METCWMFPTGRDWLWRHLFDVGPYLLCLFLQYLQFSIHFVENLQLLLINGIWCDSRHWNDCSPTNELMAILMSGCTTWVWETDAPIWESRFDLLTGLLFEQKRKRAVLFNHLVSHYIQQQMFHQYLDAFRPGMTAEDNPYEFYLNDMHWSKFWGEPCSSFKQGDVKIAVPLVCSLNIGLCLVSNFSNMSEHLGKYWLMKISWAIHPSLPITTMPSTLMYLYVHGLNSWACVYMFVCTCLCVCVPPACFYLY